MILERVVLSTVSTYRASSVTVVHIPAKVLFRRFSRSSNVVFLHFFDGFRGNQRIQMPMEVGRQIAAFYENAEFHVAFHRGGRQIRTGDESQCAIRDGALRVNGSRQLSGQRLLVRRPDVNVDRGEMLFHGSVGIVCHPSAMLVGRLQQNADLNLASNRTTERPNHRIDFVGDEADEKQPSLRGFDDLAQYLFGVPDRNQIRRGACPYQLHGPVPLSQDRRRGRSPESGRHLSWRCPLAVTPCPIETFHQFLVRVGAETRTGHGKLLDGAKRLDLRRDDGDSIRMQLQAEFCDHRQKVFHSHRR